jgi:hypothetical protein
MGCATSKSIFANHPAIVASDIKYYSATAIAQQICAIECALNIYRFIPIGKL